MENMSIFDNGIHEIIVLLQFLRMLLPWLVIFGKLIENLIAMNNFKNLEDFMDILVIGQFYETTWKVNCVFRIHLICELLM